jgi:putative acetyltransferase
MEIQITRESPDTPDARGLIEELDAFLIPLYPISSYHGLNVKALVEQGIHFYVLRVDGKPVGCGGIKLCNGFTEIKRMYVRSEYRGQGLAAILLKHLEEESRKLGYGSIRLETGYKQVEALKMYEKAGYQPVSAFEPYQPDPLSLFYEKKLD